MTFAPLFFNFVQISGIYFVSSSDILLKSRLVFSALRAYAVCNHNWTILAIVLALGAVPVGLQLVSFLSVFYFTICS